METMSELNALMPNVTGGLAQYTLAGVGPVPTIVLMVGGYMISNILSSGVEASIFAYAMGQVLHLPVPNFFWSVLASVVILIANLYGVDMFAKVQDLVSYLLLGSMLIMGLLGVFRLGTGTAVHQPAVMNGSFNNVVSMTAVAFWLFIGAEYAIPISKDVKNARRNVPLGMFIGLGLICAVQSVMVLGFHNYTAWSDLEHSAAPHLLYGEALLGRPGQIWMASYIMAHIDLLIFRHRLPKAPRTFRVPFGPVLPIIGICGTVYMILHISTDPVERNQIWLLTAVIFAILFVYSVIWIRVKMRIPVFRPVPVKDVLAMENTMYYQIRKRKGIWK